MAIVAYQRPAQVDTQLSKILTDRGYVNTSSSPFLNEIVSAIKEAVKTTYNAVYNIADNIDIGKASGEYLDRWGRFLNEQRSAPKYAVDMSLSNTYIYLNPEVPVGSLTTDGNGITIPARTPISSTDGVTTVVTLDDVYMTADRGRVYTRVISTDVGESFIPAGTLTTPGITLGEIDNILPATMASYTLMATNLSPITGGESLASDETYRYVLQQAGRSIGLFNEAKINTLMDIPEVVSLQIHEYIGGVDVYLETTNRELNEIVVQNARQVLSYNRNKGLAINVYTPIERTLKLRLKLAVWNNDTLSATSETFRSNLVDIMSTIGMGQLVDLNNVISRAQSPIQNIITAKLMGATLGGKTLISNTIGAEFNERTVLASGDITLL